MSKKELILTTAMKYFSKYGYENTILERIAKECNITKPAIYYHFRDKKELYKVIICSQFSNLVKTIEEKTKEGKAEERLKKYIFSFGEFLISNPTFSAIFAREIANGGLNLPKECIELLSKTLSSLIDILDEGEKIGVFKKENPFMIQMMIVSTLTSYHTTKPLRERVVTLLEDKRGLPEIEFQNVIGSLYKKIIKGLKC